MSCTTGTNSSVENKNSRNADDNNNIIIMYVTCPSLSIIIIIKKKKDRQQAPQQKHSSIDCVRTIQRGCAKYDEYYRSIINTES